MKYSIHFSGQQVTVSVAVRAVDASRLLEVFRGYRDGCYECRVLASRHRIGALHTATRNGVLALTFPVEAGTAPARAEVVACIECCLDRAGRRPFRDGKGWREAAAGARAPHSEK